jgi:hypothetical protein
MYNSHESAMIPQTRNLERVANMCARTHTHTHMLHQFRVKMLMIA